MAEQVEIDSIRRMVDESTEDTYTDEYISELIDSGNTMYRIAWTIWEEKAARYSKAISVSESGSTRSLSELFRNAMEMVKYYKGLVDEDEKPIISDNSPFVMDIERA